jgi:hypothetical protein
MRLGGPETDYDAVTKITVPVKFIALIVMTMKVAVF